MFEVKVLKAVWEWAKNPRAKWFVILVLVIASINTVAASGPKVMLPKFKK